jgi:4-hydroxy-3-polyprenylbenzoate decarboxylase
MANSRKLVVAMTGASGAIYGIRFLQQAERIFDLIYLSISEQAAQVINTELERKVNPNLLSVKDLLGEDSGKITILDRKDYFSPPASGSFRHDGMVIVPCSMGTVGRIANGVSDDLVTRAADVCLKEKRKLILVPREMPWGLIQLRNMTQLAEAGATILPASPAYYYKPKTIEDLADTVVARILQQLGVEQEVMPQWQFQEPV